MTETKDTQTHLTKADIDRLLDEEITEYFKDCRARLPAFCARYFRYPGCWQLNKQAFGLDLIRAPINLIWAPLYLISFLLLQGLSHAFNASYLRAWARALPGGLTTRVQREMNRVIKEDLLSTQCLQVRITNRLSKLQLDDTDEGNALNASERQALAQKLDAILKEVLDELMLTRTASADIANTLFSTALGAVSFNKFTPGGIGIGLLLSAVWVREQAEEAFIFGSKLGHVYYNVFPPEPSFTEQAIGVTVVMLVLAIIASFSGLITDPFQYWARLHQRRLKRMLRHLEADVKAKRNSQFKTVDSYIARILELFDTLRVSL